MTLEELADLIRANSANTNGRIDAMRNETYATLMNIQNDFTDVRGELRGARADLTAVQSDVAGLKADMTGARADLTAVQSDVAGLKADMTEVKADVADVKRSLDLTTIVATLRKEVDALTAEVAAQAPGLTPASVGAAGG